MSEMIGPGSYEVIIGLKNFSAPSRDYAYKGRLFSLLPCPNRELYVGFDEDSQEPIFEEPTKIDPRFPTCEYYMIIPFQTTSTLEPREVFRIGRDRKTWVTTLFWLFKQGTLFSYIHDIVGPGLSRNIRYWAWMMLDYSTNPKPPLGLGYYDLDSPEEVTHLSEFIEKYASLDWKPLETAIRRLSTYNTREWGPDLIVDLFIILESLFVTGHENVSYQVRLKTATVLKGTDEIRRLQRTPEEVYEFIKEAYTARSGVVHGSKKGQKWLHSEFKSQGPTRHNVHELEEIVRSSLRQSLNWLSKGQSLDPKQLDKLIFLS